MQINIIGGSGFIGTRLSQRLNHNSGGDFLIIDKKLSKLFPENTAIADVTLIDSLRGAITEGAVIVNLAAEHRDDVKPLSLYDEVNVDGAYNVCSIAREKQVHTIVFTSTVAVYGFAPMETDETGAIAPFNDYGRTKYAAEQVYKAWHAEAPDARTLVIVRPTVVFGEQNRGNVYNLLRQIASGRFVMIGNGENKKSMAYVENIAAFLQYAMKFKPGVHIYNYVDKPDISMNAMVTSVKKMLKRPQKIRLRLPYTLGYFIGGCFDLIAWVIGKKLPISRIRVKKFCTNSVFASSVTSTGFEAPTSLTFALHQTVQHEFIEPNETKVVFYSE